MVICGPRSRSQERQKGSVVRRREFITLLGSAVASWPLAVRAQEPAPIPVVGFLHLGRPDQAKAAVRPFSWGLARRSRQTPSGRVVYGQCAGTGARRNEGDADNTYC